MEKPVPGQTLDPTDIVAISPNSPPSSTTIGFGGAKTLQPTSLDDLASMLNGSATTTNTLYISGHGGGGALPGTSFGDNAPGFFGNLPPGLIGAIQKTLTSSGTVVIDSCQDTSTTTPQQYQQDLNTLAKQLGRKVIAAYGSTWWDSQQGIVTDGTWMTGTP